MNPRDSINIESLRRRARRRLPLPIFDFLEGGADDEWTAARNSRAFERHCLRGRALVDVSVIDTRTRLFGQSIDWPVIIAPTGASQLFHPEGERAVARAASATGTLYALSTMSNTSLEAIAAASSTPRVFQLYVFKDRGRVESLVDRCRRAGYAALCLTVDTPLSGNRERDRRNGMSIPPRFTWRNLTHFALRPAWSWNALRRCEFALANFSDVAPPSANSRQLALDYVNSQFDRTVTWHDAAWLARLWGGPLAIKGIVTPDDARRAVDIGATAVWISNHGGRQLDGMPSTVECLPAVRKAVGDQFDIILDGGIRRGTHVLKALALGATACALGRPCLYGLAAGGEAGVALALWILRTELERCMALAGCARIGTVGPWLLQEASTEQRTELHPPAPTQFQRR